MKIINLIVVASLLSLLFNNLFGHFFSMFLAVVAWLYCGRLSFLIDKKFCSNHLNPVANTVAHMCIAPASLFVLLLTYKEDIIEDVYKVYNIESIQFRKPIILKNKIDI